MLYHTEILTIYINANKLLFQEVLWDTLHNLSSTPHETMVHKKTKGTNNTDLTHTSVKI